MKLFSACSAPEIYVCKAPNFSPAEQLNLTDRVGRECFSDWTDYKVISRFHYKIVKISVFPHYSPPSPASTASVAGGR
jgi:hypothetical protein